MLNDITNVEWALPTYFDVKVDIAPPYGAGSM
jgi:hypothetical protein